MATRKARKRVKVIDRGFKKEIARLSNGVITTVGIQGAEAPAGDHAGLTNAGLGAIHEFGAPGANIPERSFIRSTFDAKINDWVSAAAKIAERVYSTTPSNPVRALGVFGELVVSDIRKTITRYPASPQSRHHRPQG